MLTRCPNTVRRQHRAIILNRGSMPHKRTGWKWCNYSRPQCATSQRDVTKETARSLANGPSWGGRLREKYVFCVPREFSYLSFVYGRSLWAELNGGENSLHWKTNMLPLFYIMTLWKAAQNWQQCLPALLDSIVHAVS